LGLITVQLLKASGCRVIGLDLSDTNFALAKELGCDYCTISDASSVPLVESFTKGRGTDAVIITAGTKSNEPIELSMKYARKKSCVVVVGAVGMSVPRKDFYEKEIDIKISCSYGPGRYDQDYEDRGNDYPLGYVRWTENRNMEAAVELMAAKQLKLLPLLSHRIPIENGVRAYELITGKTQEPYIGVLLAYPQESLVGVPIRRTFPVTPVKAASKGSSEHGVGIGFIGAGNFAQSYLIPSLKSLNVVFRGVATDSPVNAKSVGTKFGFEFFSSDPSEVCCHPGIDAVFIATRHDSHAGYVMQALNAGKHVFVEKPLAVNLTELDRITAVITAHELNARPLLMVGFNRRFSKPFRRIKGFFLNRNEPMSVLYRVNAGFIPKVHWVQDPAQGGRIVGEACHFFDTMQYLTDALPVSVYASSIRSDNAKTTDQDSVNCLVNFSDGSTGNLLYLANGDSSLPKEYCEVNCGGRTALMKNFTSIETYEDGKMSSFRFDGKKGHREEVAHFISAIQDEGTCEMNYESLHATTLLTLMVLESLRSGDTIVV
jgi:predicted dehydrogenase